MQQHSSCPDMSASTQSCKRASVRTTEAMERGSCECCSLHTAALSLHCMCACMLHVLYYQGFSEGEQSTCEKRAFLVCRAKVVNLMSQRRRPSSLKASLLSLSLGPYLHQTLPEPISCPASYSAEPSPSCMLALRARSRGLSMPSIHALSYQQFYMR